MVEEFYKYHGAGNDFLIADNRDGHLSLTVAQIRLLCDRHIGFGADGVILLADCPGKDFGMDFFNPDGSGGMMCGNGGRCIVAFAADRGVVGTDKPVEFQAPDGPHSAVFISSGSQTRVVSLKMKDVKGMTVYPDECSCFMDTGTRHLVKFVSGLVDYPVCSEGKALRFDHRFATVGANVNFVEPLTEDGRTVLHIRTFEKGVEDETLACGTGIVAAALAAYSQKIPASEVSDGTFSYDVKPAIARLSVRFRPSGGGTGFDASDIWLTGPAAFIGSVKILL